MCTFKTGGQWMCTFKFSPTHARAPGACLQKIQCAEARWETPPPSAVARAANWLCIIVVVAGGVPNLARQRCAKRLRHMRARCHEGGQDAEHPALAMKPDILLIYRRRARDASA